MVLFGCFFVALNLTTQKHSICVVYRTFKKYMQIEISGHFLRFVSLKGLTRLQIILHSLFDLPESNQFKFIFTMNHRGNV